MSGPRLDQALIRAWGCFVKWSNPDELFMECHYLFIWLFCKLFIYWIINSTSWQALNYAWLNLRLLHSDATLLQCRIAFARHTWKLNHPPRPFCLHLKQKLRQVRCKNISLLSKQERLHLSYTCSDLLHTWCPSVCTDNMHYLSGERKVFHTNM